MAAAALVLNNRNLKVKQTSAHKLINKLWYHHKTELYLAPTEIHHSMDESQKHYAEQKKVRYKIAVTYPSLYTCSKHVKLIHSDWNHEHDLRAWELPEKGHKGSF